MEKDANADCIYQRQCLAKAWNFSEGKTGGGRVDVRGVGWLVLIAVGLATIEPHSGEQAGE